MFYQLVRFVVNQKDLYCIWYSDDEEGFLCKENRILLFNSVDEAKQYAFLENITLDDTIYELNTDRLRSWIESYDLEVDCKEILDSWNIFIDIASSVESNFLGNKRTKNIDNCYNKLFCGNNILIDNESDLYYPDWTKTEIDTIKKVLKSGINLITSALGQPH